MCDCPFTQSKSASGGIYNVFFTGADLKVKLFTHLRFSMAFLLWSCVLSKQTLRNPIALTLVFKALLSQLLIKCPKGKCFCQTNLTCRLHRISHLWTAADKLEYVFFLSWAATLIIFLLSFIFSQKSTPRFSFSLLSFPSSQSLSLCLSCVSSGAGALQVLRKEDASFWCGGRWTQCCKHQQGQKQAVGDGMEARSCTLPQHHHQMNHVPSEKRLCDSYISTYVVSSHVRACSASGLFCQSRNDYAAALMSQSV